MSRPVAGSFPIEKRPVSEQVGLEANNGNTNEVDQCRVSQLRTVGKRDALASGGTKGVLKATFERRYKDKNGEWKSSNSFGRNEVPLVKWCLDKAFEAMVEERSLNGHGVEETKVR